VFTHTSHQMISITDTMWPNIYLSINPSFYHKYLKKEKKKTFLGTIMLEIFGKK